MAPLNMNGPYHFTEKENLRTKFTQTDQQE